MIRGIALFATIFLTTTAQAEVRLINTTGAPLVVDLLSAEKQQKNVDLPANAQLSAVLGSAYSDSNASNEMVVIRDASGKELVRKKLQTNSVFLVSNWGAGLTTTFAGRYTGKGSTVKDAVMVINVTGKQLAYETTNEDFSVKKGKGRTPNDRFAGTADTIRMPGAAGKDQALTLSVAGNEPFVGSVARGGLYILRSSGQSLSVDRLK